MDATPSASEPPLESPSALAGEDSDDLASPRRSQSGGGRTLRSGRSHGALTDLMPVDEHTAASEDLEGENGSSGPGRPWIHGQGTARPRRNGQPQRRSKSYEWKALLPPDSTPKPSAPLNFLRAP